jgi:TolB protein
MTKIVFISDRDSLSRNVYVMNIDGSEVKALTHNDAYEESPSWSPDGNQILFTRQLRQESDTTHAANGEIFIMNANGSGIKRLTKKEGFDSGAVFSPNGKQIAFYGSENNFWDIFLMNADGTGLTNLTKDSTECYSPSWSPDGKWIAYVAGNSENYEIWMINVNTKKRIRLTNSPGRDEHPEWLKK